MEEQELVGLRGTRLCNKAPGRQCSPPTAPGFPAGSLRPASPRPPMGCVRGRGTGRGPGGPSSQTSKPAPSSQAAHPVLRGHFPWDWKAPGPFLSGGGALAASCDAFCKPENWHLGRRCQMPCQTWFRKVSADTA